MVLMMPDTHVEDVEVRAWTVRVNGLHTYLVSAVNAADAALTGGMRWRADPVVATTEKSYGISAISVERLILQSNLEDVMPSERFL